MSVQSTYTENMAAAFEGDLVNTEPNVLISRTVEDAAGIGFGKIVQQGSADGGVTADLDTSDMDAFTFVGVTVRDRSVNPATPNKFAQYESGQILRKGVIWVMTDGAVDAGEIATVTLATGVPGNTAVTTGVVAIPNARWDSSTSGAALAKLRIG